MHCRIHGDSQDVVFTSLPLSRDELTEEVGLCVRTHRSQPSRRGRSLSERLNQQLSRERGAESRPCRLKKTPLHPGEGDCEWFAAIFRARDAISSLLTVLGGQTGTHRAAHGWRD